jgi:hypothetical protein
LFDVICSPLTAIAVSGFFDGELRIWKPTSRKISEKWGTPICLHQFICGVEGGDPSLRLKCGYAQDDALFLTLDAITYGRTPSRIAILAT